MSGGHPSPLRGHWLPLTVVVVLAVAGMVALGFWQIGRLQGRRAANAQIVARLGQPPLSLDGRDLDPEAAQLRRATVRGAFDFSQEIVLRNRAFDGTAGIHVLVPLRIAGTETAILVDRGWLPFELSSAEQRAAFREPAGAVTVSGVLRRSQARPSSFAPADPPLGPDRPRLDAWFRVDLPAIQRQMPYPLLPVFLEEETPAGAAPRWLPRTHPDLQLHEGSHLFYAVQWFGFALLLPLGYAFFFVTRRKTARADTAGSVMVVVLTSRINRGKVCACFRAPPGVGVVVA